MCKPNKNIRKQTIHHDTLIDQLSFDMYVERWPPYRGKWWSIRDTTHHKGNQMQDLEHMEHMCSLPENLMSRLDMINSFSQI